MIITFPLVFAYLIFAGTMSHALPPVDYKAVSAQNAPKPEPAASAASEPK